MSSELRTDDRSGDQLANRPGGRSRIGQTIVWVLVAVVGATAWGVLALVRHERISALWLLAAALGSYAIAYRFYARFIVRRLSLIHI